MDSHDPHDLKPPTSIELTILRLASEGASNKQIATAVQRSPLTIKSHLARIGTRYGLGQRAALIALAYQERWLTLAAPDDAIPPPTPDQLAVIELVAAGASNREIGVKLFIAKDSVTSRLKKLMRQYNLDTREGLTTLAYRNRWLELPELPDPSVASPPMLPAKAKPAASEPALSKAKQRAAMRSAATRAQAEQRRISRGGLSTEEIYRRWPITCAGWQTLAQEMSARVLDRAAERALRVGQRTAA